MSKLFDFVGVVLSKLFKSKTLIVNVGALVAGTITLWLDSPVITDNPQVVAALGAVLAAVNVVLRYATTLPLSEK
jgi:hypothetical protein